MNVLYIRGNVLTQNEALIPFSIKRPLRFVKNVGLCVWPKMCKGQNIVVLLIISSSTIDRMFKIYTFLKIRQKIAKIGPKFTLCLKIDSKFTHAFCSKIVSKLDSKF